MGLRGQDRHNDAHRRALHPRVPLGPGLEFFHQLLPLQEIFLVFIGLLVGIMHDAVDELLGLVELGGAVPFGLLVDPGPKLMQLRLRLRLGLLHAGANTRLDE
eukprot:284562_1